MEIKEYDRQFGRRPTDRGRVLRPLSLPQRQLLLPNHIDFGLVEPGTRQIARAGIPSPPADANVSVSLQRDTSGGRFIITQVQVFDVVLVDPSELPGPQKGPVFELVLVGTSDGSSPVAVTTDQAVAALVSFIAPVQATGENFTAALEFVGDQWPHVLDLPIKATVGAFDLDVTWEQANPWGILLNQKSPDDPLEGNWFAGHVNAVLPMLGSDYTGSLLVGANTGGVWLVRAATPDTPALGQPLSNDWVDPNITCLAQGPVGPEHFYAAASYTGVVYETNPLHDANLTSWRIITPQKYGGIFAMGIVPGNPNRIVIASAIGVFWAAFPSLGAPYVWQQVTTMVDGSPFPAGTYSGLAVTGSRVVVAAYGVDIGSGHYGTFHGDWSSGDLLMVRADMPPRGPNDFTSVDQTMYRTSLAVCDGNPNVLFSVSSAEDASLGPMLRSGDGGRSWQLLAPLKDGQGLHEFAGKQGDYNNCIAVDPHNASTVAIGWQNAAFLSHDGGQTFTKLSDANLHSDVHGLTFDPSDPSGKTLYIGSDGGVAITRDGSATFDSTANRNLANLECYSTFVTRDFYGTLSVQGDLIACGLQDNSNVVCQLVAPSNLSPWANVDGGCDGGVVMFIGTGHVLTDLVCSGTGTNLWARRLHGRSLYDVDPGIQVPVRADNQPNFFHSPVLEAVNVPAFRNAVGQLMYAVASPQGSLQVFGLFADANGNDLHGELIGNVPGDTRPDIVSALGSVDGTSVLIGTNGGRALLLVPSSIGVADALAITVAADVPTGAMTRILALSPTLAFANYNGFSGGVVIRYDGSGWIRSDRGLPGDWIYCLASRDTSVIFTATDDKVFTSRDQGQTWMNASSGLPRRAHCADLRRGGTAGVDVMYLSTFGRSLWVAAL